MIGPRGGIVAGDAVGARPGTSKDELLVGRYPIAAAQMAAAVGFGTWSAGWMCDEASGSLSPAFGSPSLTAGGAPTYGNTGPLLSDRAVGFRDNAADSFNAGNTHDVGTGDLCLAWAGKIIGTPTSFTSLFTKSDSASGWLVFYNNGSLVFQGFSGASVSVSAPTDWYAGMAVIDESTSHIRLGVCALSGTPSVSVEGATIATYATTASLTAGANPAWLNAAPGSLLSSWYIGNGSGAATGMSANLSAALSNFVRYLTR